MKRYILSLALMLSIQLLAAQSNQELANSIQITRTEYGVPHINAPSLRAVAFGLAWCEIEDYGDRVITPLLSARGDIALIGGYDYIDTDGFNQLGYRIAQQNYHKLDQETRDLMEGFASGVNFYLEKNPEKFPLFEGFTFTGYDVLALTTSAFNAGRSNRFREMLEAQKAERDSLESLTEAGSNAWAFAPSRTKSGKAILVRNPHLSWTAGYYEAHLHVPGLLNFYGDFRIGGVFAIIGGFSEYLGFCTTNNGPDLDELYALKADPDKTDHFLIDGISIPLERKLEKVEFKNGEAIGTEIREFLFTPYGPVTHRDEGYIYVLKHANDGNYLRGQQYTRMLLAKNYEEWREAMRMQAIVSSNYTYADAEGNIFYVWNASIPDLPQPSGGDSSAVFVESTSQIWRKPIPFDELPQVLNPKGGYLHNENDPFHFTNLNKILQPDDYPDYFPRPRLRQRSQHSLLLIDNNDKMSLEDVVDKKHSMRMLLADQLKEDLLTHLKKSKPKKEVKNAMSHLKKWDNTVAAASRGGLLFEYWWNAYRSKMKGKELYATPWSFDDPMNTPNGIADPEKAVTAFSEAMDKMKEKYDSWDLAWGDIHRLRLGDVDLPVGGGPGGLGCFRVLWFNETDDNKRRIRGGDGWQLAVEFSNPPKAYSILAYGQSNNPDSPHHTDQTELFANNKMKVVRYAEDDVKKYAIRSYKPGE
ncbi:MAG: penicillin acylase family protein [Bacteroidota bacterium]